MDEIEGIEFELGMIRYILLINPNNSELSSEELDKLVLEEYKASKEG